MVRMSVRATYAIDPFTAAQIKRLAAAWGVSQAEVIRRSIRHSAEQAEAVPLSPADVVAHYARQPPPRDAAQTRAVIASLRELRHQGDKARADRRS